MKPGTEFLLFLLTSTEHETYHGHKCCWHLTFLGDKYNISEFSSKKNLYYSAFFMISLNFMLS